MEATARLSPSISDWKELYKAALFEDDNSKLLQRIAEAERAVSARTGELFGAGGHHLREQQDIENALYFLDLLRKTQARVTVSSESVSQSAQRVGRGM